MIAGLAALAAGIGGVFAPARAQSCAGQTELVARSRALASTDLTLIQRYLACFPDGPGVISVRMHEGEVRAAAACEAALRSDDDEALRGFIVAYSTHECAARAAGRLKSLLAGRSPAPPAPGVTPPPPQVPATPQPQPPFQICASINLADTELRKLDRSDFQACLDACAQESRCSAFTYNSRSYLCSLKVSSIVPRPQVETLSGLKLTPTALPGPGARMCLPPCGDGKEIKDGQCVPLPPAAPPATSAPPVSSPSRPPPAAQNERRQGQGQGQGQVQRQGAPSGTRAPTPATPSPPAPSAPRQLPIIIN